MEDNVYRNLDGVYFRVERGDKWLNVCFSDMTREERNCVLEGRNECWLKELCNILADTLRDIGDAFDIVGGCDDER